MSERARGKNHPRPGTPPRQRRELRPGRNRLAKGYDAHRGVWTYSKRGTPIVVGYDAAQLQDYTPGVSAAPGTQP